MSEQVMRSPGFFDREIDLSAPAATGPVGVPAGVIGTAAKGPAFVPITFSKFVGEFDKTFGPLDPKKYGPYAVNEFLKHRSALTYLRVLGAGANTTDADITTTNLTGRVKNAGFHLDGLPAPGDAGRKVNCVQFLVANHTLQTDEALGMPMFTDNSSFAGGTAKLIRGVLMSTSGSRVMVLNGNESTVGAFAGQGPDDFASISSGKFKIVVSSSLGSSFGTVDGNVGIRVLTASLNPTSTDYFAKVLNTDPERFNAEQHLLYADFAVDDEVATPNLIAILSGSASTSNSSGDKSLTFLKAFGAFDTRYSVPSTPWMISQPFGATEYDLFRVEPLDDGSYANSLYKISIVNVKASLDDAYRFGTFTLQVRDWNDTDTSPIVLEQYVNCSLDPLAENYVVKVIGDRHVTYNFDAVNTVERRIVAYGKYPNKSTLVRVVPSTALENGLLPATALPFGFRGMELLKTNDALTDTPSGTARLAGVLGVSTETSLSGAIVPPIPFRTKVTKGSVLSTAAWVGQPGASELVSPVLYWGVKFERNTDPLNANVSSEPNKLLRSFTHLAGIRKLDVLLTGSAADTQNNNKFTLARVAFSNQALTDLTSSVGNHMKEAAYIRNGRLDSTDYRVSDPVLTKRVTLATLLAQGTASDFNRFAQYTKFSTFMAGGYDGVNILDAAAKRMNDISTSFDTTGGAEASFLSPGFTSNLAGAGQANNAVASYKTAIDIMTDPLVVNTNILMVPGIREPFLTDHAAAAAKAYSLAIYIMDIPSYDEDDNRLYDDSTARPDVDSTISAFNARVIDNNYAATYFPDVSIQDDTNKRRVKVPASIAALGAYAYNDRVTYPWYAPAGFNRAALDFVKNVAVRLNVADRDALYESRINPIATFPREGFVIYGQKTLQIAKSALDRVNVRRMLLEVKRVVIDAAKGLVFSQPSQQNRDKFKGDAGLALAFVQIQQGIESFKIIMDDTNNTAEDEEANRLRGTIVVVPTRAIENIAIDFVITASGVSFS